jgi:hypothetical protein
MLDVYININNVHGDYFINGKFIIKIKTKTIITIIMRIIIIRVSYRYGNKLQIS